MRHIITQAAGMASAGLGLIGAFVLASASARTTKQEMVRKRMTGRVRKARVAFAGILAAAAASYVWIIPHCIATGVYNGLLAAPLVAVLGAYFGYEIVQMLREIL